MEQDRSLFQICDAQVGMQGYAKKIEEMRHCANAWKSSGKACIETHSNVHDFIVKDEDCPKMECVQMEEGYTTFGCCVRSLTNLILLFPFFLSPTFHANGPGLLTRLGRRGFEF